MRTSRYYRWLKRRIYDLRGNPIITIERCRVCGTVLLDAEGKEPWEIEVRFHRWWCPVKILEALHHG